MSKEYHFTNVKPFGILAKEYPNSLYLYIDSDDIKEYYCSGIELNAEIKNNTRSVLFLSCYNSDMTSTIVSRSAYVKDPTQIIINYGKSTFSDFSDGKIIFITRFKDPTLIIKNAKLIFKPNHKFIKEGVYTPDINVPIHRKCRCIIL